MQYPVHTAFVAPATARPQVWRLLVGLLLALIVYALGFAVLFGILTVTSGIEGAQRWMVEAAEATGPTGTLLLLSTFAGMALGPMLAARVLHGRTGLSLLGPLPHVLRSFVIAAAICGAVYFVLFLIPDPAGAAPVPNLDFAIWASFLPLAIVGVLLQTGAEEILFRGYIQQQLAARFQSPLVWMVLPSFLFALGHYQPQIMGDNAWLVVVVTGAFALMAADLTAATGSIGAAWGLHFANNAAAILFVGVDGPLSGLALYVSPMNPADAEMQLLIGLDLLIMVAVWWSIRLATTRFAR